MIKVIAKFQTTLSSGISETSTELILTDNKTLDNDGATLPTATYGFVIDEENAEREYLIGSVAGSTVTIVARGLSLIDGMTEKADNKRPHRKGASVKIVNHPVLARIVETLKGDLALENIPKLPSARVINNDRHLVDKEYADAIAAAGITSLLVADNGGTTVNVGAGYLSQNGEVIAYAGAANQSLADDDTNYIQIKDGVLNINTTGFDDDAMPLAEAVCSSGDITSLVDRRAFLSWLAIKPNYGIARGTDGVFIDLAANSSLEFNSGKLKLAGTIEGAKTFDTIPVLPASDPTADNEATRKSYVDNFFYNSFTKAAGDELRHSNDTAKTTSSTSYVKVKEIVLSQDIEACRIKFTLHHSATYSSGVTYYGRIYKNGVAIGTERSRNDSAEAVTHSQDFTNFSSGDLIQIYAKVSDPTYTTQISNFRIYYDLIADGTETGTNQDPS